ncbi:peptidyl-alpha-hydroxyglycine alpha-amidating lyase family protein [Sphingomonas floccifaciens]|uniref:Peptidyl-alpha-hydroxyglycine alpha-amidating lyase family protein n=1 Tax=Sphingomonas floccifaciens TaxID=1844115 RepID=A0ABW4N7R5_9SPHN
MMSWMGTRAIAAIALLAASPVPVAQADPARTYTKVTDWARLPPGVAWAEMTGVAIDAKGNIYTLQRTPSKVMVFSPNGQLLRTWGEGAFAKAHAIRIDRMGDVWITDRELHQAMKFTPEGKPLMALGTRGVAGDNDSTTSLNGPADLAFAPNGDIFVADGESTNTRVVRYDRKGHFLAKWGTKGSGDGQLMTPHSIVMDRRGRLYVANRGNKRVEIFDQTGRFLGQITNAATPYGLAIAPNGTLYVADGTAGSEGMTVLDTRTGAVLAHFTGITGAHMVAVDAKNAIYVAEVRGRAVDKFVPK